MRLSLPPGSVLHGQKGSYTVINIVCVSERSVTVSCTDEQGKGKWRLKLYNGASAVSVEVQKILLSNPVKGVVLPCDTGGFSGLRFSVTPEFKAVDAGQFPIPLQVLTDKVIPQMADIIHQYHQNRILLRDICPSHILYRPEDEKMAYCGLNNAAVLKGNASTTKAPGHGQSAGYLAPEIEKYGYSVCSDYFSFGATILSILRGSDPAGNLTREAFLSRLSRGVVPGIDVQHLRDTPYELYSAEDKVLYLALGLMLPDPAVRWGYGEIRCWCSGQSIPLMQGGKRVHYQFARPYTAGGGQCWNQKQLAAGIAAKRTEWTDSAVRRIAEFAREEGLACSGALDWIAADPGLSAKGKIFRYIYTLDPAIVGLWWDGRSFSDTGSLVDAFKKGTFPTEEFSRLLRDRAISFLEKCREGIGISSGECIADIEAVESLETSEPGKGVQRCMMMFANDPDERFFTVDGEDYRDLSQLLLRYKDDGKRLRELSSAILLDPSFQAWLWAKGMEQSGTEAVRIVRSSPERGFYLLLCICERSVSDEGVKKLARRMFLRWGDYAPVVWLSRNIRFYKAAGESGRMLYDTFSGAGFEVMDSLDTLSRKANALVSDYQIFVGRTLKNPFVLENEDAGDQDFEYYPLYESGYFCCSWINGLEVCPAFLKSVGEVIDAGKVGTWLRHSEDEEIRRLQERSSRLSAGNDDASADEEGAYSSLSSRNLGLSVFMMIAACVLFALSGNKSWMAGAASFAAGGIFPAHSFLQYYKKKVRVEVRLRNRQVQRNRQSAIDSRIGIIRQRGMEVYTGIVNGQAVQCRVAAAADAGIEDRDILGQNAPDLSDLDLGAGQKVMAYISTYGYVMMAVISVGDGYSLFAEASIYAAIYGLALPYLLNRRRLVRTFSAWSATTLTVAAAAIWGGAAFGSSFFVAMNWAPVVCLIAGGVLGLFLMFM